MRDINELSKTLAGQLGIDELCFSDEGLCSLSFDDRCTVTLEIDDEDGALYLYCNLGKAPEDIVDQLSCFAALLEANLFGRGSAGANLGLEADSRSLMISRALPLATLDAATLQLELGRFVQAAETWRGRVAEAFWQADEAPAPAPATPTGGRSAPGLIKV